MRPARPARCLADDCEIGTTESTCHVDGGAAVAARAQRHNNTILQAAVGLVSLLLDGAGVDDDADAAQSERGLSNIRRDD